MANVLAFFGILLVFALCYPALILIVWHTQPAAARAQARLERSPGRCIALGMMLSALAALPVLALLGNPSGAAQLAGWLIVVALLGASTIGAAGLAVLLGQRIRPGAQSPVIAGAVALELAAFFPVLGWIFALPVTLFAALGATPLALFTRERAKLAPAAVAVIPAAAQ